MKNSEIEALAYKFKVLTDIKFEYEYYLTSKLNRIEFKHNGNKFKISCLGITLNPTDSSIISRYASIYPEDHNRLGTILNIDLCPDLTAEFGNNLDFLSSLVIQINNIMSTIKSFFYKKVIYNKKHNEFATINKISNNGNEIYFHVINESTGGHYIFYDDFGISEWVY